MRLVILIAAIAIGLAERIARALGRDVHFSRGEAADMAIALSQGRGFADAFFPGQGPTAHLLPTSSAIAAAVYAIFGVRTAAAETLLFAWSMLLVFGAYALICLACTRIGVRRQTCFVAFVLLAVAPVYTTNDAFDWRAWEGALALVLAAASLLLLLRAEDGIRPWGFRFTQAALPALTFFVSPVMGVTAFACWAFFVWRHRVQDGLVRPILSVAVALTLLITPWAARNYVAMGTPILLRDNLGMELAVANYQGAVAPADPKRVFLARLTDIQPWNHPIAQRRLIAAGGEIAYSRQLGREATSWMRAHPGETAILWTRHLREMLFTRSWMFRSGRGHVLPLVRTAIVSALALLALAALVMATLRRDLRYAYAALHLWVPTLLYVPFQPVARYTWLIWPVIACLACDATARLWADRRTFQSISALGDGKAAPAAR